MLNIHRIIHNSAIYGPYLRTVIWFQGCTLRCHNCINQELWSNEPFHLMNIEEALHHVENQHVTLLGGEPLQQRNLYELVIALKQQNVGVILFTGYSLSELDSVQKKTASLCDVVISGRYLEAQKNDRLYLRGSDNQIITFNSNRYDPSLFHKQNSFEINIQDYEIELRGRQKNLINQLLDCYPLPQMPQIDEE